MTFWPAALAALPLIDCERGCALRWLNELGVVEGHATGTSALTRPVVDCPDGLARCVERHIEVSRLAAIAQPCRGPESACSCPWEQVASCPLGCVVDELEVIMDREAAPSQLCAEAADRPAKWIPMAAPEPARCEEGQLYRCVGGSIIDCAAHAKIALCNRGCVAEGGSIDQGIAVSRESAFAILCSH